MGEVPEADRPVSIAGSGRSGAARSMDPLTSRLVVASGAIMVAILLLTAAFIYFARAGQDVARTAVERDAIAARANVKATPKDPNAWIALASADIAARKYDEAAAAVATLESMTKRSIVLLLKGDLAAARGDLGGARKYYELTIPQAKKDHEADVARANLQPASVRPSREMIEAYLALARIDMGAKDYRHAVENLQAALKVDPNAADTLTMLGDAQAGAGQKDAAIVSYKQALKFVPDYQAALDGLKRVGGRQ